MDKLQRLKDYAKELESRLAGLQNVIATSGNTTENAGQLLGDLNYRVLHVVQNPVERSIKRRQDERDAIRRENERLRARLALLEAGDSADVTRRIDDAVNSTSQIDELTKKVAFLKEREDRILSSFKRTSQEFREACYLLTGYRVDPLKDDVYRLSHMYAEHEEDKLFIEVKQDGTINLLKNDYTDQYKDFISTYLENADSFPAFLAAITLDLFKASTQMDMSVNMSTTMAFNSTMRPNSTMRKH